ncbi:M56 family metallopeptidase [Flavobacteriaceae sp. LMIT009]
MIQYIVQVVAFQLLFLIAYDLFLKKETFFNWNRAYLLVSSILSFIIPLIKINLFSEIVPQAYLIALPAVEIGNVSSANQIVLSEVGITQDGSFWTFQNIFILGASCALLLLVFKVGYIIKLLVKNPRRWKGDIVLVKLLNSISAFSFLHYVFIGEKINKEEQQSIFKHEMVHVTQKHTLDLLYFEVLRVLFWFNPLVYMYQNRIRSLHEFIADQEALKTEEKQEYYQSLLAQVFETQNISFINTFFKESLIKKRIVMLQKNRSERINLLKYLFLVPMILGMLVYTSSYAQEIKQEQQDDNNLVKTLLEDSNTEDLSITTKSEEQLKNVKVNEQKEDNSKTTTLTDPNLEVSFSKIENPPIFKECKDKDKSELRKCTVEGITKHVQENFNIDLANELGLVGRQRIAVMFKINKKGNIEGIRARATHPDLEAEAIRVIKILPQMLPGKHKGKKVIVPYSLPIIFQIDDKKDQDKEEINIKDSNKLVQGQSVEVPYNVIDEPPVFKGCEDKDKIQQKKCTSEEIQKHVLKSFNANLASNLGLVGKQRISTIFKINKLGEITDIKVRAPHTALEEETKRVISSIPQMVPGKHNDKEVVVLYSLPIIFQIEDKKSKNN